MFRLGRIIDKIRQDIKNAVRNNRVTPDFVDKLIQRVFIRGKNAAYVTHGAQHGMPASITQQKLRIWIRESSENGKLFTVAFDKFLGATERTNADAQAWLELAGYQSTMRGSDSEAAAIAVEWAKAKMKDLGFDKDKIIRIGMFNQEMRDKFEVLRNELKESNSILEVGSATFPNHESVALLQ